MTFKICKCCSYLMVILLLIIAQSGSVKCGWINLLTFPRKDKVSTSVFSKDLSIHDVRETSLYICIVIGFIQAVNLFSSPFKIPTSWSFLRRLGTKNSFLWISEFCQNLTFKSKAVRLKETGLWKRKRPPSKYFVLCLSDEKNL